MTGRIPAIETRAYGCRFRSRLEARWAIFLTEAGFDWEYEPEGAELAAGRYLCDFKVRRPGGTGYFWMEVKPSNDEHDDPRWAELARVSGMMLLTVRGMHRRGDRCGVAHSARVWLPDGSMADIDRWGQQPEYEAAWDRASGARFDGKDGLKHPPGRGPRRGRRRK